MPGRDLPAGASKAGLAILAASLVGCDHATKLAAKAALDGRPSVPIAPDLLHGALELRYTKNEDIAFSAFRVLGLAPSAAFLTALSLAALVVAVVIVVCRLRSSGAERGDFIHALRGDAAARIGFVMAIGGGLGNILDRAARGGVVDFIHVRGWPIFNVADIAIVVGMLLVALRWRARRQERRCDAYL